MNKNLPGVYTAKKKDNSIYYRSSITLCGKHISLGSYPDEWSAHLAYQVRTNNQIKQLFHFVRFSTASIFPSPFI